MGKLNFKKREWIVREMKKGKLSVPVIAKIQKVGRQHCYRIMNKYERFGDDGLKDKQAGRPKEEIPQEVKNLIRNTYNERPMGAIMIEKHIEKKQDVHIPHNQIHNVLLELGYAKPNPKKRRQRKYCRYERKHSNSLWHVDWKWLADKECWIIAYIDDHSRFITAWGKFKEATGENALIVLVVAIIGYGLPRAILTDRGTQFYCSEKEGKQQGITEFQKELSRLGIRHILGRVQHPQTNGKIERWFGTYVQESHRFSSTEEFVEDYNYHRPHMTLDCNAPADVYFNDFMKMLPSK